jgi:uncharacterized protein (DUF1330 family)
MADTFGRYNNATQLHRPVDRPPSRFSTHRKIMSAFVIVEIEIRDPETYERYKQIAPPSIAAYGGRYVVRGGTVETLEGTWQPKRLVVLEFPTIELAHAWWASPEYAEGKALRQSCADTKMIVVPSL